MQKTVHKTQDKNHARWLMALLMLHRGEHVSTVARTLCCARSSVGRWINWFTLYGREGLKSLPSGRSRHWLSEAGLVWRRAAPALHIRDPHRDEKMAAITAALASCSPRISYLGIVAIFFGKKNYILPLKGDNIDENNLIIKV